MAETLTDEEVAQEFREYLKDLEDPKALEIRWLTQMASDQSDHATTISKVLKDWISTAPPTRKLWALYVLDSIAKNLAGAFTQHLSPDLYETFWNAYTRVDNKTRQAMVNLLNSWENPGPGVSVRSPVFPVDVTSRIRQSLDLANAAIARAQHQMQPQSVQSPQQARLLHLHSPQPHVQAGGGQPWRHPTPTQYGGIGSYGPGYLPHQPPPLPNGAPSHQSVPTPAQHFSPYAAPAQTYTPMPQPQLPADYHEIMQGLGHLLHLLKMRLEANPYDDEARRKLTGITQLQSAVQNQPDIKPEVWAGVKHELHSSLQTYARPLLPSTYQQTPTPQPSHPAFSPPMPHQQQAYNQPSNAPALDPGMLASVSAALSQQRSSPQTPKDAPYFPTSGGSLHPETTKASTSAMSGNWKQNPDVLKQLSALSGLLDQQPSAAPPTVNAPSKIGSAPGLGALPMFLGLVNDVELSQLSLRKPRPELTRSLWNGKSQCRTCGRRFAATEEGQGKKRRHMDYHFRSRMRLSDMKQSTISTRSWFVDEMEWIHFREVDDAEGVDDLAKGAGLGGQRNGESSDEKLVKETLYVRVPSDTSKANKTCPICQDEFQNVWHAEAQEWVWMDCIKGPDGRYYHHSCRQDVEKDAAAAQEREERARERDTREREAKSKSQQAQAIRTATKTQPDMSAVVPSPSKSPESVLGKRKALDGSVEQEEEGEDENDYEPSEHERRVSRKIEPTLADS